MAQANSAQREPSMEEILASIRRIIEDNDAAGRRQASEPAVAREAVAERTVIEVDAFRGEQRTQPEQPVESAPMPVGNAHPKPNLAEIQAQIAREAAAVPASWTDMEPEEPVFQERRPEIVRSEYQRSSDDIRKAIENSRAAREDARALLNLPEPANNVRPSEMFHEESAPAPQPEVHHAPIADIDSATAEREALPAKPALLSERVERQVAASFSELSDAFAARSRKTFDEMAEEMIAPLLRDWMENNLPTLVERLVREEIERVARGA